MNATDQVETLDVCKATSAENTMLTKGEGRAERGEGRGEGGNGAKRGDSPCTQLAMQAVSYTQHIGWFVHPPIMHPSPNCT